MARSKDWAFFIFRMKCMPTEAGCRESALSEYSNPTLIIKTLENCGISKSPASTLIFNT